MSIINNAHPGSQIRIVCLIDRVLNRRKKKKPIARQALIEICRPENLTSSENSRKRFSENLDFWLNEGLWRQDPDGISHKDANASEKNLPFRVLDLMVSKYHDQNILKGNRVEPFLRTITVLLALNRLTFRGQIDNVIQLLKPADVADTINSYLPEYTINASNEANTLRDWGMFLGFIEPFSEGMIIDPTRAIETILPSVFNEQNEMPISDFIGAMSTRLPMTDNGAFRKIIEPKMEENGWEAPLENYVSASLSHSLIRLKMGLKLSLPQLSDDKKSMRLMPPDGKDLSVGIVRYMGDH